MTKKTQATHKQFVDAYLSSNDNGTAAYRKIKPNVTYNTAAVEASKLLRKPNVIALIEQRRKELEKEEIVTRKELLQATVDILKRNQNVDDKVALLAIDRAAKMIGADAPEKKIVEGDGFKIIIENGRNQDNTTTQTEAGLAETI